MKINVRLRNSPFGTAAAKDALLLGPAAARDIILIGGDPGLPPLITPGHHDGQGQDLEGEEEAGLEGCHNLPIFPKFSSDKCFFSTCTTKVEKNHLGDQLRRL